MLAPRTGLSRVLLAGALALTACRGGDAPRAGKGPDPGPPPLRPRDTSYRPPPGGELTAAQVRAFVAGREALAASLRSGRAVPAPSGPGTIGFAELRDLELDAAQKAGLGAEEYLWVKERVLEAEAADVTAELNANALAMLERTLKGLEERRAAAADEPSRALIDEQLRAFSAEAARIRAEAAEREPAHVEANRRVVRTSRGRLTASREEIERAVPRGSSPPSAPRRP